jgi:hypothetical protein
LIEQHQHLIEDQYLEIVNKRTLTTIIKEWEAELGEEIKQIDFLSIDTEGTELQVVSGFDFERYQPKIIALENNFDDFYYRRMMWNIGYVLYEKIGVNDYFIYQSYLPKLEGTDLLDLRGTPIAKKVNVNDMEFKIFNK